ncbi:ribosomal protein L11 methyltransferase [Xenorhabdus mauleonii]|uniref:Release factor glutamine methyltransferase n=1 Tax=Xenorhabdus mauleonii TaxID=351675 RepID=A0A1I3TRF5_9GAMM|nr:class I SAM-dependent methyltransferase [Xenorhabdus mauleonii]PHM37101.1 ribosomal protein L11 methyltransferase [Xenorhabdus mauleonii]SFJ72216.1 release factor glutamine methyltransferase [Xenorhabdus mauleonii]
MNDHIKNYMAWWLAKEKLRKNSKTPVKITLAGIKLSVIPQAFLPAPLQTHSTPLLIKNISHHNFAGKKVLDIGTGSGVLAIYAALNGASLIIATDIDDQILHYAKHNAYLNQITDIHFMNSNLFESVEGKYNYIFANGPISPEAWSEESLSGHTISSYGETLFSLYRNYLTDDGLMFMTFAEFGPVEAFYKTLQKYSVIHKEKREEKFGIWWSFHEISK